MENTKVSIKECKRQALEMLKGNWKKMLVIMLVMMACTSYIPTVLSLPFEAQTALEAERLQQIAGSGGTINLSDVAVAIPTQSVMGSLISLIAGVFAPMLMYGIELVCVKLMNGEEPRTGHLFRWKMLGKAWLMNFARVGLTLVVALIMMIGGVLFAAVLGGGLGAAAIILIALAMMFPVLAMTLMWSMAEYIWTENEGFGPVEVLHESARRMKGHKWTALLLSLSFTGWIILAYAVSAGVNFLLGLLFAGDAPLMLTEAIVILMVIPLNVYIYMTSTIFYREVNRRCEKGIPEDELENETDDDDEDIEPIAELPQIEIPGDLPPMTANETIAYDMLSRHGFSKKQMEKEGVLQDYEKLNVHPVTEARWERSHVDRLAEKYADEPAMLNGILAVAAEYGSTYALDTAINLVDRAIWRGGAADSGSLLIQCNALQETLQSPAFADIPAVVSRKQAQIDDMIRRLETR